MVAETDHVNMTVAVEWDVKNLTKSNNNSIVFYGPLENYKLYQAPFSVWTFSVHRQKAIKI